MAANESVHENEEFFQTALEEFFTELTLECNELSRITNENLTSTSNDNVGEADNNAGACDPNSVDNLSTPHLAQEQQEHAKDFLRSSASTPKRKLQFAPRQWRQNNQQLAELTEESIEDQSISSCAPQLAASPIAQALTAELESTADTCANLPSLSVLMRQHRRELILSPFSQKLKSAILRQDGVRQRQKIIEQSKKSQRVSLRV